MIRVAQGVAGVGLLEPDDGADVAGVDLADLLAVVGVHLEGAPDALLLALRAVEHVRAGLERARVDPEERQVADERVGGDLEDEARQGLLVVDGTDELLVGARLEPDRRRDVERRGQELGDRVEHRLDALVLERRAGEHGHELGLERPEPEAVADLGGGERLALEVLVGERVVGLGDDLDHLLAPLRGVGLERLGDLDDVDLRAEVVAIQDRLHLDEVDDALEAVLAADRQLDRHRSRAEAVDDHVDAAPEVGAGAIELVDEADPRHGVLVRLAPDGLGLGLDAGHAVEDDDRAIEDAQAALDLDGEVHVPGRIDDVDLVVVPEAGRGRGGDGDAALLLLRHPVHRGRALVDLAELVDLLRVEEDSLGHGRLARVDVGNDPDVPRPGERYLAWHGRYSSRTTT